LSGNGELLLRVVKADQDARAADQHARLELKRLALESRRLDLLEQKVAQADAARDCTASTALTMDEKESRLREIFGLEQITPIRSNVPPIEAPAGSPVAPN
jgi:hypothetical protein